MNTQIFISFFFLSFLISCTSPNVENSRIPSSDFSGKLSEYEFHWLDDQYTKIVTTEEIIFENRGQGSFRAYSKKYKNGSSSVARSCHFLLEPSAENTKTIIPKGSEFLVAKGNMKSEYYYTS